MTREALKLALEVLERASDAGYSIECEEAITSIKAALAFPDPVLAEREACALICDKISDQNCGHIELDAAADIIRARSQS